MPVWPHNIVNAIGAPTEANALKSIDSVEREEPWAQDEGLPVPVLGVTARELGSEEPVPGLAPEWAPLAGRELRLWALPRPSCTCFYPNSSCMPCRLYMTPRHCGPRTRSSVCCSPQAIRSRP